jgi:transposase-like protein
VARLTDERRNAVIDAVRASLTTGESVRSIARRLDVSPSTVSTIARECDAPIAARPGVKNATEATVADNAKRRAELSKRALDMAAAALDEIESGEVIVSWTDFGSTPVVRRMDGKTTPKGRQALMTAFAIAMDKHRTLDQYDAQQGMASAVDDWLLDRLGVRRGKDAGGEEGA